MEEVLIAGAGPTGLMLANLLTGCGIKVRIIDKMPGRSKHSKALGIHARTLEIFDILGLANDFLKNGIKLEQMNIHPDAGSCIPIQLKALENATRYPYMFILPQSKTEEILENALNKKGIFVERNTVLTGFEEEKGSISITLESHQRKEIVKAAYLAGCDGAHSTVRKARKIDFPGSGENTNAMIADVPAHSLLLNKGSLYLSQDGVCLLLPVDAKLIRIIAIDKRRQDFSQNPLVLEDVQSAVNRFSGLDWTLKDPVWLTHFSMAHRQVPSYLSSRIILAGDAAHIHNPIGGQGMNTGIQDAANLAWKLAAVLKGKANPDLLNTYQDERHPVAASVIKQTNRVLHAAMVKSTLLNKLRAFGMKQLLPRPFIQKKGAFTISEIAIHYRNTKTCRRLYNRDLPQHSLQAGDRMPDARLKNEEGETRICQLLSVCQLTLFVCHPADKADTVRKQAEAFQGRADIYFISEWDSIQHSEHLVDFSQEFKEKTGVSPESVLAVRPDGYVAFHLSAWDLEKLEYGFNQWKI